MSYEDDMFKALALLEEQKAALFDTVDSSHVDPKTVYDFACTVVRVNKLLRKRTEQLQQTVAQLQSENAEQQALISRLEAAWQGSLTSPELPSSRL
jgi:hypothetical protein